MTMAMANEPNPEHPSARISGGATLRIGFGAGLVVGGLAGLTYVLWCMWLNLLGPGRDAVLFTLYVVIPYAFGVGLLGLIAAFLLLVIWRLLGRTPDERRTAAILWGLLAAVGVFVLAQRSFNRTIYYDDYAFIHSYRGMLLFYLGRTALAFLGAVGLGYLVGRVRAARRPLAVPLIVVGAALWAAALVICRAPAPVVATAETESGPFSAPLPRRVLLIGLDGATWRLMDPLMEQGKLPHLSRLVAEGARADFETPRWADSARLWTSILGGKDWQRHGIRSFYYVQFRGLSRPVTLPPHGFGLSRMKRFYQQRGLARSLVANRSMRRGGLVWDILSEAGMSVGVTGAITTWPVDPVAGYLVSDVAGKMAERRAAGRGEKTLAEERALFPPAIEEEVGELLTSGPSWRDRVAPALMRAHPADFTFIYFEEIDAVQHLFWHELQPQCFSADLRREAALVGSSAPPAGREGMRLDPELEIVRTYVHADSVVGELLEAAGEVDLVMVISDHGAGPVFHDPVQKGGHFHGPPGIIILAGKGVQPGARLERAHILDVTPTILGYLGLPVAEDMAGRVLWEAFDPMVVAPPTPASIPTYDVYVERAAETVGPAPVDEALEARLRALGYIK